VISAAVRTTASGRLQDRDAAALMSRAIDSPSTIKTKSWNRSARCALFSGTRRRGVSMARAPAASVSNAAPQNA
jgi:hypothetical protein